jgi:hypothetical protein
MPLKRLKAIWNDTTSPTTKPDSTRGSSARGSALEWQIAKDKLHSDWHAGGRFAGRDRLLPVLRPFGVLLAASFEKDHWISLFDLRSQNRPSILGDLHGSNRCRFHIDPSFASPATGAEYLVEADRDHNDSAHHDEFE